MGLSGPRLKRPSSTTRPSAGSSHNHIQKRFCDMQRLDRLAALGTRADTARLNQRHYCNYPGIRRAGQHLLSERAIICFSVSMIGHLGRVAQLVHPGSSSVIDGSDWFRGSFQGSRDLASRQGTFCPWVWLTRPSAIKAGWVPRHICCGILDITPALSTWLTRLY
jgi:hypothetical protein